MRTKNSIINISAGLGNQLIITLLSFVSRTVFINSLGIEYLGINGLLTNIFAMLALAEAGIGSSIMYSLYKPVAENDQQKINVLMKLYRNAYLAIAIVILVLGLTLLPFLDLFIRDTSADNINVIYIIFLINTVIPYLYLHKNSFLNVSQKGYIVTAVYSVSSIVSTVLKIAILYYTQNYILFLLIESVITITTTIILASIVNRMYPFLKNKVVEKLDIETKQNIMRNVKAIVMQNIGVFLVFGTDNIIISSFISVAAVGLYSNYVMLIDICRTFINQIFNNIYHSVANLVAKENKEKIYNIYKVYYFLNFWLYSFFTIALAVLIEPFILLWLGKEYLMGQAVLIVLMIIFYERGMRNAITTVKTTAGIFHEDRYAPLCQAAVNLIISIILVKQIGIVGVFIGTMVSSLVVPFWTTPYLVYKKVFNKPLIEYFSKYFYFLCIGVCTYYVTSFISGFILLENLLGLFLKGVICLIIPNVVYTVIFYKTSECRYLYAILRNIMNSVVIKMKSGKVKLPVN
ncbi:lipopolysaccharide biosynthesis protein [Litchfieldia salsa]|uniref:Membrane protein involved in the export of O-antigen and teichoic acid n=1 Tax=Litchfieldia salsa TaxID=930152 RepID=A0A1H0VEL5_9BACI|nr:oligosaccharide flippase family protein [Litchfieldia salsa]SDP76917.1 Membrane protein involved in the export of O-antigen and teichoic acid [Litchfieldia salsa]